MQLPLTLNIHVDDDVILFYFVCVFLFLGAMSLEL